MREIIILMFISAVVALILGSCSAVEPLDITEYDDSVARRDSLYRYAFIIENNRIIIEHLNNTQLIAINDISIKVNGEDVTQPLERYYNYTPSPVDFNTTAYTTTYPFEAGSTYHIWLKIGNSVLESGEIVLPSRVVINYYNAPLYYDITRDLTIAWDVRPNKDSQFQIARLNWRNTSPYIVGYKQFRLRPADRVFDFEGGTAPRGMSSYYVEIENLSYTVVDIRSEITFDGIPNKIIFLSFSKASQNIGAGTRFVPESYYSKQQIIDIIRMIEAD
jgi:hypothetical protein